MPRGLDILLGAIVGVLTAAIIRLVEDWFRRRNESLKARSDLLGRYLLQLQDAVESLWYRLDNLRYTRKGAPMSEEYFTTTTLYALGLVLAYKRILLVDGIYARLEEVYKGLGEGLRYQFNVFDGLLDKRDFHRYERLVLAETMMDSAAGGYSRTINYVAFQHRYEDELVKKSLSPARRFISVWITPDEESAGDIDALMLMLTQVAANLSAKTGLPKTI